MPCGDCNACCRSSYFVQIRAEETAALGAIPEDLRFPAPGAEGGQVLGYDQQGCCPMLQAGTCSIYAARPQTCRDYDCRIFAACGITAGGEEKHDVNQRVAMWRFSYPSTRDETEQQALREAMDFLASDDGLFGADLIPTHPTQLALLAIEVYELFMPDAEMSELDKAAHIRAVIHQSAARRAAKRHVSDA